MIAETLAGLEWRHIGQVGVDSGTLMIGDPCYSIGRGSDINKTFPEWSNFVDAQFHETTTHNVPFKRGHDGAGVVARTTYGDGVYDVYGLFDADRDDTERPHAMLVFTGDAEMSEDGQIIHTEE